MKKITFTVIMATIFSLSQAQTFPLDFSDPNDVFSGNNGSSASIVVNPTGCSSFGCTGEVLEINGAGDQFGDPVSLTLVNYVDLSNSANNTITLQFFASRAGIMLFQMGNSSNGSFNVEISSNVSVGLNTLSLDFDTATNAFPNQGQPVNLDKYSSVFIFVDFTAAGVVATHWADNIAGGLDGGPVTAPTLTPPNVPAPTPPARAAGTFISIYGDAYGTAVGITNVPWDDPTVFNEEMQAGANVLKIDFGTSAFMGSNLNAVQDATSMTHFHMDFWISDNFQAGQVFNTKWSNHTGGSGETDAGELTTALAAGDVQKWVSIDVPLTDFNNVKGGGIANREALTQFLITAAGLTKVAYIDNVYLHQNSTLSLEDFEQTAFKVFPNPVQNILNVQNNQTNIQEVQLFDITGRLLRSVQPESNIANVDFSSLSNGIYLLKVTSEGKTITRKIVKN